MNNSWANELERADAYTRELVLNYRVKLEHNAKLVSNQTQDKINGRSGRKIGESGFRELMLNYRVNQECSYKEVKGLATLDYR